MFATPWPAAHQAPLSFTISWNLLRLMFIESMMPSNHLILCYPLLLLRSIFPSIRVFSNELTLCIRWPKDWSFNFSISPSSEYSGLISFRIDCFDFLAVQGTLKSLLQHHSWSIHSSVLSFPYGPTLPCVCTKSLRVRLFAPLWTAAHQAPLSMEFSRQEYWSGLPFPSPIGDLPNLGIEPSSLTSPALAGGFFTH